MAKITFCMIVLNGDAVLRECLAALLPYGKVVVAEGPVGFFARQGIRTSTDRTNDILRELVGPENVIHSQFREKDQMMNAVNHLIPDDTTHVWMVDSDEVWRPSDIEAVIAQLDEYDSVAFKPDTFFGGFDHILTGFEQRFTWYRIQRWYPGAKWATHRPPTVLSPDGKPWRECRHWDAPYRFAHYSYVFPRSVKAKIAYYESRNHIIPDYFQRVYLPWALGNDITRRVIEDEFDGVHEWLPAARGDCRTQPFTGTHPPAIAGSLPRLRARFEKELEAYR